MLANTARANDDAGIGACIAECILSCLASIVEYFNKWAYVYVGIYGYSYLEAGKGVMQLFKNRGWEAIITDVRTRCIPPFLQSFARLTLTFLPCRICKTPLLRDFRYMFSFFSSSLTLCFAFLVGI